MDDIFSGVFYLRNGIIYVERSVFAQNKVGIGQFKNVSVLLKNSFMEHEQHTVHQIFGDNSNITILNSTIVCKQATFGTLLFVSSDGGDIFNYLAIKESHLRCSSWWSSRIFHLADVDIQNSSILFKGQKPGFNITSVLNVRIAHSEFYSDEGAAVAIGFNTANINKFGKTNFYTYNAKFKRKESSTLSNSTQFLENVKEQGLIEVGKETLVTQEETVFASSK